MVCSSGLTVQGGQFLLGLGGEGRRRRLSESEEEETPVSAHTTTVAKGHYLYLCMWVIVGREWVREWY